MTQELINSLTEEIKQEVSFFYNVNVNDQTVKDFINNYYLNEDNKEYLFDDEGNYYFETTEREDFMIYLDEVGVITLKK
jgi:F0F1-type ATP synthase delta subunit